MKKDLIKIIKYLSGNILLIGVCDDEIFELINNNDKIVSCDLLNQTKKNKMKRYNGNHKSKSRIIRFKKIRKIFKKKNIDFVVCNYNEIEKYMKSFVSNSVYINRNMLYIYGDFDTNDIIDKYKRYNVSIKEEKYKDGFILFIDNKKSKNKFFMDKIYYIIDTLINLRNIIADLLMG